MRPSTLLVSLAPAAVLADSMTVLTLCDINSLFNPCTSAGFFVTAYDTFSISANKDCRSGPHGMYEFCVDWTLHRAHFYFTGQPKRCFAQDRRVGPVVQKGQRVERQGCIEEVYEYLGSNPVTDLEPKLLANYYPTISCCYHIYLTKN
ncbi:hypothetical protein QBC34DRAFT_428022 [Podospora aff. communis PSN243]|uniref:Ecp2 effector protein domain-containing protein n=1 Tax=Podospora aff. communis PSN243 TaxID=3040156 RepID=A0AAV9GF32_9PEZI|nr:hypothetical protein QBC34DRAFT_428022 [Podospora aff. communis PSN243]